MTRLIDRPVFWAILIGVLAAAVYAASFADPTPFNHYVLLADAFLHGRVDLIDPPYHLERTTFRGRHYVIPPPFPAVLLVPYVAVKGVQANQSLVSYLVGGLAAGLNVLLAARLLPRKQDFLWFGVLGAFGTIVWYLAATGSTWYFAHVIVVAALTMGVLESVGRRRPLVMGSAVAVAFLTRQPSVMTLPYFLIATTPLWAPYGLRGWRRIEVGYLNRLAGPVAVALGLNSLYNWVRFGMIADVANALRQGILDEPWFAQGLFHYSYIPRHLTILFEKLPVLVPSPPYMLVPWTGLALWVTTPAFVYALRAPATRETLGAWLGIGAVALVIFSYGYPGMSQFGYRFATDFYPLLMALTLWGTRGRVSTPVKVLILLSVLVNVWGVVFARMGWTAP